MSLRLLIADDHALMRAGIRSLLERTIADAEILEATDGRSALEMAIRDRPDIVLMDITMPGLNGLDAGRQIVRERPECKVIMLSMHKDEERIVQAIRAGASGYLMKDSAFDELALAIQAVQRGETFMSSAASTVVTAMLARNVAETNPAAILSSRQREILQLIAEGHSTKEIGYRLALSAKTVETHRRLLMQRLDIYEVAGLARFAVRAGLVSAER